MLKGSRRRKKDMLNDFRKKNWNKKLESVFVTMLSIKQFDILLYIVFILTLRSSWNGIHCSSKITKQHSFFFIQTTDSPQFLLTLEYFRKTIGEPTRKKSFEQKIENFHYIEPD